MNRLALAPVVLSILVVAEAAHPVPPPVARLLYTGQSGPQQPWTITGFPGCAPHGMEVVAHLSDGSEGGRAPVADDGSFRLIVDFESGRDGITLSTLSDDSLSVPVSLRLDYPLIGMRGDPGVIRFGRERSDAREAVRQQREWTRHYTQGVQKLETWAVARGMSLREARMLSDLPDSVRLPTGPAEQDHVEAVEGEGIRVSGYVADGDTATVIMGASGESFVGPMDEDGWFSLLIPPEALVESEGNLATFIVNITDTSNQILNAHGANPLVPEWVMRRDLEIEKAAITGKPAPDFTLPWLDRPEPATLSDFRGQRVLLVAWATWCGSCHRELDDLQSLYARFSDLNTVLFTVNLGDSAQDVRQYMARGDLTLPVLLDEDGMLRERYSVFGVPRAILIDEQGTVVWTEAGYVSPEQILQLLM